MVKAFDLGILEVRFTARGLSAEENTVLTQANGLCSFAVFY